jgi:hypothetical protein
MTGVCLEMKIIEDAALLEVLIDDYRKEIFEKLTHKVPLSPGDPFSYNFIECFYPDGKSVRYFSELHVKEYSLVPIFVNAEKNLEKICVLIVNDKDAGTLYYYVLVKKEDCNDTFPLPVTYFFSDELQLNAKKTLILDDNNKCFRVFFDSRGDAQFTSMYLVDIIPGYKSRDGPEVSNLTDNILCVASGTTADKFLKSYHLSEKVMNFYRSKGYLLLRIGSFSHEKLKAYMSTHQLEPLTLEPTLTFQHIFENSKYLRKEKIFPYILDHIKTIQDDFRVSGPFAKYFTAVLVVLQSSGYGKSRTFIELGTTMPVFYSSLQAAVNGFPKKSYYLDQFIVQFDSLFLDKAPICHVNTACAVLYTFILRIIYLISKSPYDDTKAILLDQAIDSVMGNQQEANFSALFTGLQGFCNPDFEVNFNYNSPAPILLPEELNKFDLDFNQGKIKLSTSNLEQEVASFLRDKRKLQLPCLFVIDEAHFLLNSDTEKSKKLWSFFDYNSNSKADTDINFVKLPYQVFRRTFRLFSTLWELLWLVVISTNGKIGNFITDARHDPSRKIESSPALFQPFVLVHSYSCKSEIPKPAASESSTPFSSTKFPVIMKTEIDERYLQSIQRVRDLFNRGRPLVRDTLDLFSLGALTFENYINETIFRASELRFLFEKICCKGTTNWIDLEFFYSETILYSILGFSTGLSTFPSYVKIEDLVENNLMTLLNVDNNNQNQVGGFFPEGPLNGIASWFLCKRFSVFEKPLEKLVTHGICDIGLYGELIARIILLHCQFYSIDPSLNFPRKPIFVPLKLESFLTTLSGNEEAVTEIFSSNPHLEGSMITFSYFQYSISETLNPYEAMLGCYINGSAVCLKHSHPGADFLIPLILKGGRLSFLAVQVKLNRSIGSTKICFLPIYGKMRFSYMFSGDPKIENDRTFALLILSLSNNQDKLNNTVFALTKEDLEEYDQKEPASTIKKRKFGREGEHETIFQDLPEETELPPALVICGSSFNFIEGYGEYFQKLVNRHSPRLNPIPGLPPNKLSQLEALMESVALQPLKNVRFSPNEGEKVIIEKQGPLPINQ